MRMLHSMSRENDANQKCNRPFLSLPFSLLLFFLFTLSLYVLSLRSLSRSGDSCCVSSPLITRWSLLLLPASPPLSHLLRFCESETSTHSFDCFERYLSCALTASSASSASSAFRVLRISSLATSDINLTSECTINSNVIASQKHLSIH